MSSEVSGQVRLKLACSATEASRRLESFVTETRDITLSRQRTTKALICAFVVRIWHKTRFLMARLTFISARPRTAEYIIGICFETAKKTKAFECFVTGFQHSLWKFSTNGNLYSLKFWLWLAAVACVLRWQISNALLNDIWLTRFTRMCN